MPIDRGADFSHWETHGDTYSEPMWLEGGTVTFDGFGLMTFRGSAQCRDVYDLSAIESYKIPMFGNDVGSAAEGFYVSKLTKKLQANHTAIFDVEAIGIEPRCKGMTRIAAEGMSTCSMEPIETHWNFPQIGGTKDEPMNGATFDDKGRFTGFSVLPEEKNSSKSDKTRTSTEPLAGVRSYYAPKNTFRGYFHCDAKIYTPDMFTRLTDNPVTSDGKISGIKLMPDYITNGASGAGSWLLTSMNPEPIVINQDGGPVILKVTYELLRARTTWNPLIYISGAS